MRFDVTVNENLDQDAKFFDQPVPNQPGAELWLNFEKVKLINSTGIRRWMQWCKDLPADIKVYITQAPLGVVEQAHLIDRFFPKNCEIQSIRSFFYCERDTEEQSVLLKRGEHYFYAEDSADKKVQLKLPQIPCPLCAQVMQPDFLENRVFAFLKTNR